MQISFKPVFDINFFYLNMGINLFSVYSSHNKTCYLTNKKHQLMSMFRKLQKDYNMG